MEQTRELYSDRRSIPAIHPRYGMAYREIYGEDQIPVRGTLGLRAFLCFMLFAVFVTMKTQEKEVLNVDSYRIVEEITYDLDVAEVWKNLCIGVNDW